MRAVIRATLTLLTLAVVYYGLERLTVFPLDPRHMTPAAAGLPQMTEEKHGPMVVWRAEPRRGRPTLLYLQGNAGHLAMRKGRFERFLDRGYGIVAPAYRGGSGSKGWPREAAITRDISELYGALFNQTDGRLILYGESIGAAVALAVLRQERADPMAVILEAPFTSLRDVARHLHPGLLFAMGLMLNRWDSIDAAPSLQAPVLVLHGETDPLVPIAQGRAIFEAAGSADKLFYTVKDAGHVDVWTIQAQRVLFDYLAQF